MAEVNDLLSKLSAAANDLKGQVIEIDRSILACQKQRDTLTSAPVSKSDFLEYLKYDIRRKYDNSYFLQTLKKRLGGVTKDFGALEMAKNGSGLYFSYLNIDSVSPDVIRDEAVFFYFEEVILSRISTLLDNDVWPDDAISVTDRKELISGLDAQIAKLKNDRKNLTDQLSAAGMRG